ncbi:hypothetical protein YC2023_016040 [Brassica napus]
MIDFLSYPYFIFPLILFFKYLHIKKKFYWLKVILRRRRSVSTPRHFVLPESVLLLRTPLSPLQPNPKPTLVSLSISSHVCYLGLVLPLPRTDEIHIPNPSWMQSPSYEEAWNEPHICVFLCVGFLVCARLPRNLGLILRCFLVQMKVAFGGTSNALAFPGIVSAGSKSTQKGMTECSCCRSNFTSKGLVSINLLSFLCAKRQKMLEDMEKDFEGTFFLRTVFKSKRVGQEADKFDGGEGSKSSGSLDIRLRVEKVQAPLCDWKTATLEYSL